METSTAATTTSRWLDGVRIASPCGESWADMHGDERVRHCARCELNVYDLSAMTRDEAAALIESTGGTLCARVARRADGTVITSDCPVGLARARRTMALVASAVVGVIAGAVGWAVAALSGRPQPVNYSNTGGWSESLPEPIHQVFEPFDEPPRQIRMGKIALTPPPAPPQPAAPAADGE